MYKYYINKHGNLFMIDGDSYTDRRLKIRHCVRGYTTYMSQESRLYGKCTLTIDTLSKMTEISYAKALELDQMPIHILSRPSDYNKQSREAEFKINDKYTAYYARLFHAYQSEHPVLSKIFEVRGYTEEYKDEFWAFHKANPNIYDLFQQQAIKAYRAGRTKLSSKQLIGWIRWEVESLNVTELKTQTA